MSEIFPSRIREAGVAIGTSTQWLFNFVFSQATPHAVENLGWKTFVMFAVFNFALLVFVWFFIKETKGRSLEEMEARKSTPLLPPYLFCPNNRAPLSSLPLRSIKEKHHWLTKTRASSLWRPDGLPGRPRNPRKAGRRAGVGGAPKSSRVCSAVFSGRYRFYGEVQQETPRMVV